MRERGEEGDRRGLKGPDYGVSSRIQRVAQQLPGEIPTLAEEDSGNKRAARAEAASSQGPGKRRSAVRRADSDDDSCIYYTEKRGAISGIQQGPNCPEHPVIHNNKHVISRRLVGALPGTSAGLAAGVWIFLFLYLFTFMKNFLFYPLFQ